MQGWGKATANAEVYGQIEYYDVGMEEDG